jgi:hypothetical protein
MRFRGQFINAKGEKTGDMVFEAADEAALRKLIAEKKWQILKLDEALKKNPTENIKVMNGLRCLSWLRNLAFVVFIGGGVLLLALQGLGKQEIAGDLFLPYIVLVTLMITALVFAICPYCRKHFYIWWLGGAVIFFQTKCTHCGINFKGKLLPYKCRNWGE